MVKVKKPYAFTFHIIRLCVYVRNVLIYQPKIIQKSTNHLDILFVCEEICFWLKTKTYICISAFFFFYKITKNRTKDLNEIRGNLFMARAKHNTLD